jgi:hypothetical protein
MPVEWECLPARLVTGLVPRNELGDAAHERVEIGFRQSGPDPRELCRDRACDVGVARL